MEKSIIFASKYSVTISLNKSVVCVPHEGIVFLVIVVVVVVVIRLCFSLVSLLKYLFHTIIMFLFFP